MVASAVRGLPEGLSWATELERGLAVDAHEDTIEEGLVELAAKVGRLGCVRACRVGEHGDGGVVGLEDFAVVVFGGGQEDLRVALLLLDALLLDLEQIERDGVGEVGAEKFGALVIKSGEVVTEPAGLGLPTLALVGQVCLEIITENRDVFRVDRLGGPGARQLLLHVFSQHVGQVAALTLVSALADKVEILALGESEDETSAAASAVHGALEVVVVHPVLLAGFVVGG